MINLTEFKENLELTEVPVELEKLIYFQNNISGFENYAQGFGVLIDDKGGLKSWSEDENFLNRLWPFAQANGTGSFYAIWNDGTGLSAGAELDRTNFYCYPMDGTAQKYEYRQTDINSGFMYEYGIGGFVITGKTGVRMTRGARLFNKQESFNDPVFEATPDPTFYGNVGVSFNPFTFLKKKR